MGRLSVCQWYPILGARSPERKTPRVTRFHGGDNPALFTTKLKALLAAGVCSTAALTGRALAPTAANAAICPSASDGLGHSATLCVTATTSGIGGETGGTVAVSG